MRAREPALTERHPIAAPLRLLSRPYDFGQGGGRSAEQIPGREVAKCKGVSVFSLNGHCQQLLQSCNVRGCLHPHAKTPPAVAKLCEPANPTDTPSASAVVREGGQLLIHVQSQRSLPSPGLGRSGLAEDTPLASPGGAPQSSLGGPAGGWAWGHRALCPAPCMGSPNCL